MALQRRSMSVRFQGGIETKMDSKAVPSVRLLALENAVFAKAVSLIKRNGYASLERTIESSAALLTGAIRLGARGDELLAFTPNRCYSRRSQGDAWSDVGAVYSVAGSDAAAVRTGTQQTMPDHATASGVTAYAWEDSRGGVWWTCVDATSGRVFRAAAQLDADGQRPRCVAVGTALHVYWANAVLGRICVAVVNPSIPSATVTGAILVDDLLKTNPAYDVCATTRTNAPALIAWAESGTTNVRIGFVDGSGVLGSPSTGHPSVYRDTQAITAGSPIAVAYLAADGSGDEIAAAWVHSGNVTAFTYATAADVIAETNDTTLFAATDVQRIALVYAGTRTLWCAAEEDAAETSEHYCRINSVLADTAGVATTIRSVCLASRAFTYDGKVFACFVHDTTYFNTYVTLRLSDFLPVGRHLAGLAAGAPTRGHLPSAHVATDVVTMSLPYRERLASEDNDKFTETGIRKVALDFDSEDSHGTAQLGRGLYLAGSCPMHYDGSAWTELGFHVGPELIATVTASGGSMTGSATHRYVAWYEWTDAQGEIHRGPTSIATAVTMGASDTQVTLTLPTLRLSSKTGVRICVARSVNGEPDALYRVTSADPSATGANGYVANDATVDSVTFLDRMSDVSLRTQEPLYTNGGILSNDPAALGSVMAGGKSRLFFSDPSDPDVVRYSQEHDIGYGVECPPELYVRCDPFGGPVTALAVMDELVVVFKERAIFVFNGNGPLPTGSAVGAGFSSPQLVTSDVGCTDPNSVAVTPAGLLFKSAKGIYQLDTSRGVSYVGAPVEHYNSQAVRRATAMPDRTQIVFLTDDGRTLLYDYLFQQWSTFTNHEGRDAIVVGGAYYYLRTDERVFKETPGTHSDAGKRIKMRLETAWLHMQEHLQGFQRFYHLHVLGGRESAHQLVIQYRTDYSGRWSDPAYLDATGLDTGATGWITGDRARAIGEEPLDGTVYGEGLYGDGVYGGTAPAPYQWRAHLGVVGQAVQFRFEDFEGAGFEGAGFELSEVTITGGVKGPARRPFSGARSA